MFTGMRAKIPYREDSADLFEAIADLPWAMFIDSGPPRGGQARYDILVAEPGVTLVTRGAMTEIRRGDAVELSPRDPFELLRQALGERIPAEDDLPFPGGAVGYFAYDLGRRIERLPATAVDAEHIPEMAVGIHDWALCVDHERRSATLVGAGRDAATSQRWDALVERFTTLPPQKVRPPFRVLSKVISSLSRAAYGEAFRRVQDYIVAGDCYQVNLAQRFSARAEGDGWSAYRQLRLINPAPQAAYLNLPFVQVLSASPERFLMCTGGHVETKPIKGTRRRSGLPQEDMSLAISLRESLKDRAENLMIVDLLRNDISRVCRVGSVRVPKIFDIESYATVHHMVSTVAGQLADRRDALDLLRACFPGGSITGAPKLRSMEIIEELEPHRRGLYCGSIGYVGFDGNMDTSIAIRTLIYSQGVVRFWAGGGIVADSREEDEYQETLHKGAALLCLLARVEASGIGA
jgi:para-aminobenzoate synthetase component 1